MPDIKQAVFDAYERKEQAQSPREYLGASSIGRECAKEIWYAFRHAQPSGEFNGRMLRLFDHGHVEEERLLRDLREAGFKVIDKKPDGEQYGFQAHDGMFRGHIDGVVIIEGEPHLLECKTSSAKNFQKLIDSGVEKCKPEHYAQMQVYMHMVKGKRPLRKALYFVVNKDNDDIYTEIVDYNEYFAKSMMERAETIIDAESSMTPAPGWKCGWCSFKNMCQSHNKERDKSVPAVPVERITCRQCVHAELKSGQWHCKNHDANLTFDMQLKACKDHVFLPDFVSFAEVIEWDDDQKGLRYKHEDGHEFIQGPDNIRSDFMTFYTKDYIREENAEEMLAKMFGSKVEKRERDADAPF